MPVIVNFTSNPPSYAAELTAMALRLILVFLIVGHNFPAVAQVRAGSERYVVAYRTEVATKQGKVTGVLEHVTDSSVVIRNDKNGYDYIPAADIREVRIKFSPNMATYTVQDFYNVDDLVKTQEGFIDLNSPQNQRYLESSPLEAVLGNVFFNAAGVLGTRGLNKLRKGMAGTITKFRVNGKADRYAQIKPDLQLYALQYQLSPEYDQYLRDVLRSQESD